MKTLYIWLIVVAVAWTAVIGWGMYNRFFKKEDLVCCTTDRKNQQPEHNIFTRNKCQEDILRLNEKKKEKQKFPAFGNMEITMTEMTNGACVKTTED